MRGLSCPIFGKNNGMKKIAILGGGNIGRAIAEGLIHGTADRAPEITITRRKTHLLSDLAERGMGVTKDNVLAAKNADTLILAVKPWKVKEILAEIRGEIDPERHLIVSIATGITTADIQQWAGCRVPVFRAMPNTAIAVAESMTCVCATDASPEQEAFVLEMFDRLGKAIQIEEELMDSATVLAACGIAYALRFMRANMQGGIEIGFDSKTASIIAAQTAKGAAELLIQGGLHPEAEIDKVTTPMGCTIAGLNEMEHSGFSSAMIKGIAASYKKIVD